MKRKIGFAVAGVMATFGALLVFLYLKDNREASTAAPEAPVDATAEDVAGEPVADDDSGAEDSGGVAPDATAQPENGSLVALTPDNQILKFGDPIDVPADYLQVTFSMTPERALGGRVRPGDTVAVLASFTESVVNEDGSEEVAQTTDVLLHKALIADVQVEDVLGATTTSSGVDVEVPEGALNATNTQVYSITIALPATQVERLVYALEYGSIWLAYQGPEAGEVTNGIVTLDNIHQEVSIFIDRDELAAAEDAAAEDEAADVAPEDLAFDPETDATIEPSGSEGQG